MSIINKATCHRLKEAFPQSFINMNYEFICHPARNSYFLLEDITSESILKCKVLEWFSREANKSLFLASREYHLKGINNFLGTNFSKDDMSLIYTHLGNSVSRSKTLEFIKSDYDLTLLESPERE